MRAPRETGSHVALGEQKTLPAMTPPWPPLKPGWQVALIHVLGRVLTRTALLEIRAGHCATMIWHMLTLVVLLMLATVPLGQTL